MKNLIRLLTLTALAATFALPAVAQTPATTPATTTPATTGAQVDEKAKAELYDRWRSNRNGDAAGQKTAYEAGKEYMQKYSSDGDADPYLKAVRKWVGNYEKATRDFEYTNALKDQKYDVAFRLGRDIYSAQPERLDIPLVLGWSGYLAASRQNQPTDAFNNEAATYARQALQQIEAGKSPTVLDAGGKEVVSWSPFTNREEAIGGLNFALGIFNTKLKKPEEAAVYFYKAAQQQTSYFGKEPRTYANLGGQYAQFAEYKKLIQDYQNIVTKDPNAAGSDEAKAILAKLDPMTDRIIDAYARAVALAGTSSAPELVALKADWMKRLTDFYKFRNNNADTGLNQFIAGVLAKPMPSATETPAAITPTTTTNTTTPAQPSTGGTNNGSATPPANTVAPAKTTPASTNTTPSTVKPASTTTNSPKPGATKPNASTSAKPNASTRPRP